MRSLRAWNGVVWAALALIGLTCAFLFSYRFVLHHFVVGPYLWDSGWISAAIYQSGFLLPNLPYLHPAVGESIFTQHVYGLASLASPLSYLFDTHYFYFAAAIGATHALTFLGPFLAVMALDWGGKRSVVWAVAAFLAGLAFAASGPVIASVGYPHFEKAIPSLFIIFIAMHFLGWNQAKWSALCLGLIAREDAGLHYACYLALIAMYQRWSGSEALPKRTLIRAMLLSVGVSVAILVAQHQFFPLGASMFWKSFIGDPPLAHLSPSEVGARLSALLRAAGHILGPMALIAVLSLAFRAPALFLAYAAGIPWLVLNVVFGLTPASQTLSLYYGFPLLTGLAWPLLAPHWMPDTRSSRSRRLGLLGFFSASLLSTVLLQGHAAVVADALAGGSIEPATFARERTCLESAFRSTPKLYADTSILAMFPHSVPTRRVLNTTTEVAAVDAEAVIFYDNAMAPSYRERARELGLTYATELTTPSIRVLSREPSAFAACLGLGLSGR